MQQQPSYHLSNSHPTSRLKSLSSFATVALSAALLSACAATPESQLSHRWNISSISGQGTLIEHTPWVEFDTNFDTHEGELKGHSGCNRFFARYKLKDGQIAFSPIGSTRKACPEPEMMQESALFKLLTTTMTLSSNNDQLVFTYNDQAVLTLVKEPETTEDKAEAD